MARPIDPLDMSPDELQARLISNGLRLAREVGLGLDLVNALREVFPDVALNVIGQAATTIGQGINAASILRGQNLGETIDLDIMPVLPNAFFEGNEAARVAAFSDVTFERAADVAPAELSGQQTWDVRVECGENITFDELIDCIEAHFEQFAEDSPDLDLEAIVDRHIHVYFAGKRF